MTTQVPLWERQGYVDESHMCLGRVKLDGVPAVVCGLRQPFAIVTPIGLGLSAEYSWAAVRRVFANRNGEFRS